MYCWNLDKGKYFISVYETVGPVDWLMRFVILTQNLKRLKLIIGNLVTIHNEATESESVAKKSWSGADFHKDKFHFFTTFEV